MSFFNRRRFIPVIGRPSAVPAGLWQKCPGCKQAVFRAEVEKNLQVCPVCGYHYRIGALERIRILTDPGTFTETHAEIVSADPLGFVSDGESYPSRLKRAEKVSGLTQALLTGLARIEDALTVLGVVDWRFIMGSMGSAFGERFCRAAQDAIEQRLPYVCFAASGGARMHEGTLALMQMVKTSNAVRAMNEAGVPFISVLTDPTSGGVFASFASLGDVVLAEPNAYIGFAGTRLIEGALGVKTPKGFQRSEYQYENGFLDAIVPRRELRPYLGRLLRYLTPSAAKP
ncbi:MAG: Acetyl-coenzyme carboxylase carboxyl transferase subunit beta [Candidatus Hydrogenedentes bacterium]|nr:Acetyl-coenzyme carboxylase carboxyl transferase subunit beta [Candidatus Hydrogenedentota bacterium]